MTEPIPTRPAGPVPGLPVTTTVLCRTARHGAEVAHPITVQPDFTITTGHDIDAERVGVALGGYCSCIELAERLPGVLRGIWEHRLRLAPPTIQPVRNPWDWAIGKEPGWTVVEKGRCYGCRIHVTAHEAAHHLREVYHWSSLFDLSREHTAVLHRIIPHPHLPVRWPDRAAVVNSESWKWLWLAGVHPRDVVRIHRQLSLRGPLAARAYLHILTTGVDLEWLAQFVPAGAAEVAWAAITWNSGDTDRPRARRQWREAGVAPRLIPPLLTGPYTPREVEWLAERLHVRPDMAGRLLARWSALGVTPAVRDIARIWTRLPDAVVPLEAELDTTWRAAERTRGAAYITRNEVAVLLAATGSRGETIALIEAGVRTLADLRSTRTRSAQ